MKKYNKLVRDYIPEIIRQKGGSVLTREARSLEERKKFLRKKLKEEVREYLDASEEHGEFEELADIIEVVYALAELRCMNPIQKLEAIRKNKALSKGAFKKGVILLKA